MIAETVVKEFDVRGVPCRQKRPAIFELFDGLNAGEALVIVNNHNPKPLYYQFLHERVGVTREYLEQGPEGWQVKIGRRAA